MTDIIGRVVSWDSGAGMYFEVVIVDVAQGDAEMATQVEITPNTMHVDRGFAWVDIDSVDINYRPIIAATPRG